MSQKIRRTKHDGEFTPLRICQDLRNAHGTVAF